MQRPTPRSTRAALCALLLTWVIAPTSAAAESDPTTGLLQADEAVIAIAALSGDELRPISVGAYCPARRNDPVREASTFGVGVVMMWALARRRTDSSGA